MSYTDKCSTCDDTQCTSKNKKPGEKESEYIDRQALGSRMCQIKNKILVLSGKGGVGKSTVAVNLASALAMAGKKVGLMDIDIHGPSIPKLLHIEGTPVTASDTAFYPVNVDLNDGIISVMSIGLLLGNQDDAVIWRGPRKHGIIKQFLRDVEWGELDYLIVDSPPGTGDEPIAVVELIENARGAIIVTTPQQVSITDVRKSISFCREIDLPILGVLENMSGFICPKCNEQLKIFGSGGGKSMAEEMGVPFLGEIPIEIEVAESGDAGSPIVKSHPDSETSKVFGVVIEKLLDVEQKRDCA